MGNSVNNKDVQVVIKPGEELTINGAAEIHAKLLNAFADNQDIVLDLNDVKDCDTAGIQLMCSAVKTAENMNKKLSLINISDAVNDAAERVGIQLET